MDEWTVRRDWLEHRIGHINARICDMRREIYKLVCEVERMNAALKDDSVGGKVSDSK